MRENIEWQNSSEILIRTKISVSKNYRVEYIIQNCCETDNLNKSYIYIFYFNIFQRGNLMKFFGF